MGDITFALRGGEAWRSPWADYRRLRDESPVHFVPAASDKTDFHVLSLFSDVFRAVRDTETFSSAQGLTPNDDAMTMFDAGQEPIVMMDPPNHTAMRRLVGKQMTPRRVSHIEDAVGAFVDACLDRVADAGDSPVDIVELLFKPLPSFVVAHYLGVPSETRANFDEWTNAIVAANAEGSFESAMDATMALLDFAGELIERKKVEPGEDLVTDLVEVGEDVVSVGWIVGFVFTMVTGGNDTMTGMLGGSTELLTDRRDQRRLLLDRPELLTDAVEELLRLTSPVQNLARTTTRDVEIRGVTIPAGEKVLLLYGSANRDERAFGGDADKFDIRRDIDKMLSLGYGAHHCLGASAARLQARVALGRLLERFPDFEVDAAEGRFAPGGFVRRYESLPLTT
ncbi:MAG: cytochrome P450 [Acidimicrobiaceae bacterium]|jgi:cytochrome P450|nr:cytochrome P450 [Acidimicrobiaceae bacterium]